MTETNNHNCVVGREGITCKDSLMSAITSTDSEFCSTSRNCLMLYNNFNQCCYIWVVAFWGGCFGSFQSLVGFGIFGFGFFFSLGGMGLFVCLLFWFGSLVVVVF